MENICGQALEHQTGRLVTCIENAQLLQESLSYYFNSSLYSFINLLNLQVVSDENSTTILVSASRNIPAILGLERFVALSVYWSHRQ